MAEINTHKVWTRQDDSVLETLEEDGVYRVKEKYIRAKMGNLADIYINVYKWLRNQASKRMDIPEAARYPIWLTTHEELKLPEAEGCINFELEIPDSNILSLIWKSGITLLIICIYLRTIRTGKGLKINSINIISMLNLISTWKTFIPCLNRRWSPAGSGYLMIISDFQIMMSLSAGN